jgi:flagellar M-ring protein FliF
MAAQTQSVGQAFKQVTDFARGLTLKQQILLGGGAVLVAATLFAFVHFTSKPEMKPLMIGMDAADAQSLGQRLAAKNIKYAISPDGTSISVPDDQVDAARLETASQPMPRNRRLGFEVFDKPNWATTDFNEKVNYQRALEGELERTLQTLDNVSAVRVHLVMPTDSVFIDRERAAKASVVLKLKRGRLSNNDQLAIARLVAGSVDKLTPENVTVIDGDTNQAFNSGADPVFGALSNGQTADDLLAARIIKTLEPVVGDGKVRASVRVEYDSSTSEENQETYDPKSQVALTSQRSEERNGSSGVAGIPGTASNVPGSSPAAQAKTASTSNDITESKSESATYAVNRVVRHTTMPAGRIKRIAAALLVDDAITYKQQGNKRTEERHKRTPEEMTQITELTRAALGLDMTRGDILSVQNISFLSAPVEDLPVPTKLDKIRKVSSDYSSVLRFASVLLLFLLVYLMVLRPVKKQLLASFNLQRAPELAVAEAAAAVAANTPELLPEVKHAQDMKKELHERIKAEPVLATRLVQTWLSEK